MALLIDGRCLNKNWKLSCRRPKNIFARETAVRDTKEPWFACLTPGVAIALAMTSLSRGFDQDRLNFNKKILPQNK